MVKDKDRLLIGQSFKEIRKKKGMIAADLEKVSGIGRTYVYKFENGKNITLENLLLLCKALQIPVSDLFKAYDEQNTYETDKIIQPHMEIVNK